MDKASANALFAMRPWLKLIEQGNFCCKQENKFQYTMLVCLLKIISPPAEKKGMLHSIEIYLLDCTNKEDKLQKSWSIHIKPFKYVLYL